MQCELALQSNELIDFNFRAALSRHDAPEAFLSIAEHKLVTVSLVQGIFVVFFSFFLLISLRLSLRDRLLSLKCCF